MNTFILAFVSGAILLLGVALYFIGIGKDKQKLDAIQKHEADKRRIKKNKAKDEKKIANLSDDDLDKLLRGK